MKVNPTRTSHLTEERLKMGLAYLRQFVIEGADRVTNDPIPSVLNMAVYMGYTRQALYKWAKFPDDAPEDSLHRKWALLLEMLKEAQERELTNKGLLGDFNPRVTVLLLGQHGVIDRKAVDNISSDGSMTPIKSEVTATDPLEAARQYQELMKG